MKVMISHHQEFSKLQLRFKCHIDQVFVYNLVCKLMSWVRMAFAQKSETRNWNYGHASICILMNKSKNCLVRVALKVAVSSSNMASTISMHLRIAKFCLSTVYNNRWFLSLNSYYVLQLREVGLIYFPNVYYPKISKQFTVVLCILFMSHANKDSPIGTVAPQIKTSIS